MCVCVPTCLRVSMDAWVFTNLSGQTLQVPIRPVPAESDIGTNEMN